MASLRPTHLVVAEILGVHSTTVLDIGRRFGATNAWWTFPPLAAVIGFDPDAQECARLNEAADPESNPQ